MKLRGVPTYGGGSYYKLIGAAHLGSPAQPGDAQVLNGGNARRDGMLRTADRLRASKAPFARDTPVWPHLGKPFQVGGQWRAAYAHGMSVPLTDLERDELFARHKQEQHEPAQDSSAGESVAGVQAAGGGGSTGPGEDSRPEPPPA